MTSRDTFDGEYKKLNKAQKEAVEAIEGPVAVVAGPGTGKTTILTLRIANILKTTDVGPEGILAITYTNSGVLAMREHLLSVIGDEAYRVNIFTFHAFAEHIFNEFPFYFEELEGAHVVTDLERVQIIEGIIKSEKLKELVSFHDEFSFLNQIVSAILSIKDEGLGPDEFINKLPAWEKKLLADESIYYKRDFGKHKKGDIKPTEKEKIEKKLTKAREIAQVFSKYQEALKDRGLYDFSDMILYILAELSGNKALKADLGERYQYILIDEHQDTNEGQSKIIELLTDAEHLEGKPNIFTVGDEKQSIYRFQGASRETFAKFQELYRDIKTVTLTENFRSGQSILGGAHSLITKSTELASSVRLHSNIKNNEPIDILEFSSHKFELLHLAEDIKEKIKAGIAPSEIAVLYRTNKNVQDVKDILDVYDIPYTIFSKDTILDDPNIRNLINILRVVHDLNDDVSLGRAMFANFLDLDAYDITRVMECLRSLRKAERKHVFAIIEDKKKLKDLGVRNAPAFAKLAENLKELKIDAENESFPNFFKMLLDKTGYLAHMLSAGDSRLQLAKIDKLFDEIKKQNAAKPEYSLADFIYFVDAFSKYGLDIKSTDLEILERVSLMTAHGSKGREFEYVYIIDATRKSWEKRRGGQRISLPVYQHDGDIEDERRLFYVAMTRAKYGLSISYSRIDELGREHEASEFINEIDDKHKNIVPIEDFEKKHINRTHVFLKPERREAKLFDPKYLRELFLGRGLNVSALNNYLDCPKKYLYRNLIQLPSVVTPSLTYGSMMDTALNNFFKRSKAESKILPKKALLEEFEKTFDKYRLPLDEEEKFSERGVLALGEYYDEYAKSWGIKIDMQFHARRTFGLDSGEQLPLSGMLDKIEYLDDLFSPNINIIDHKTGKAFSDQPKDRREKSERQLVFYQMLMEGQENREFKVNTTVLDFIEKNKKGQFEQYILEVTDGHIEKLKKEINDCANGVLSMKFLESGCGKRDCQWCKI
jgi:DNA helicase II / ATP-dependent DNA helicase PcrA